MKTRLLLSSIFVLLLTSTTGFAQSDTAHHRAVYSDINDKKDSFKKVTALYNDEPTEFALTGWLDGGEVRKIVAKCSDDGAGVEEFYLEGEKPLFVYSTYYKMTQSGKRGARVEERLYFKNGAVFKWLTTDKQAPVMHGEDYQATTERLNENCTAFVAALKTKGGKAKVAVKVLEGTFTGIEEGDYFHWKMRVKGQGEISLFILNPDKSVEQVMDDPQEFEGHRCRVTWKKSTENIPEAGGKMEIEQILSVEWAGNN
ncbi:MAG: hypothetical protein R3F13_09430 [Prosthecobacter sp.]